MLLFAYAALVALRMPSVFTKGRFWAEEGAVYFLNAWTGPWTEALFAVHTGYLNLAASVATLMAADCVPLEDAPIVSTTIALLVQLFPPLLLMTSGVPWLRDRRSLTIAVILLLASSYSAEVWLNTITSQFHLGLCAALILAMPTTTGWTARLRGLLLVAAALSGPACLVLAPLFFLRAWLDGSWPRASQAVIFAIASAIQTTVILLHPEPGREIGIGPRLLGLIIFVKHLMIPLAGPGLTKELTEGLISGPFWLPLAITTTAAVALTVAVWRSRDSTTRWLLGGGATIMTVSYSAALGRHIDLLNVEFGERYAFGPGILFALSLFGLARTASRWPARVATLLLVWIIAVGLVQYFQVRPRFTQGPSWRGEVATWRQDDAYFIQLWPAEPVWKWWFGPLHRASD